MNRVIGLVFAVLVALAAGFAFSARKLPPMPATETQIRNVLLLDAQRSGQGFVAVGEQGLIFVSDDEGASWREVASNTDATLTSVTFADEKLGLAVGHDAVILRSEDGGRSWTEVFRDSAQLRPLLGVMFVDPQRALAIGAYGAFLESTDGGATWSERRILDSDPHFNALARLADGTLLIAGEAGTLLRSVDGGKRWEKLASPYPGSFFGLLPLPRGAALVFGMRGNVLRTEDRGATWQAVASGTENTLFGGALAAAGDTGRIVLVGQNGVVLDSHDAGRSFRLVDMKTSRALSAARFSGKDTQRVVVFGEGGAHSVALPAGARQ